MKKNVLLSLGFLAVVGVASMHASDWQSNYRTELVNAWNNAGENETISAFIENQFKERKFGSRMSTKDFRNAKQSMLVRSLYEGLKEAGDTEAADAVLAYAKEARQPVLWVALTTEAKKDANKSLGELKDKAQEKANEVKDSFIDAEKSAAQALAAQANLARIKLEHDAKTAEGKEITEQEKAELKAAQQALQQKTEDSTKKIADVTVKTKGWIEWTKEKVGNNQGKIGLLLGTGLAFGLYKYFTATSGAPVTLPTELEMPAASLSGIDEVAKALNDSAQEMTIAAEEAAAQAGDNPLTKFGEGLRENASRFGSYVGQIGSELGSNIRTFVVGDTAALAAQTETAQVGLDVAKEILSAKAADLTAAQIAQQNAQAITKAAAVSLNAAEVAETRGAMRQALRFLVSVPVQLGSYMYEAAKGAVGSASPAAGL